MNSVGKSFVSAAIIAAMMTSLVGLAWLAGEQPAQSDWEPRVYVKTVDGCEYVFWKDGGDFEHHGACSNPYCIYKRN